MTELVSSDPTELDLSGPARELDWSDPALAPCRVILEDVAREVDADEGWTEGTLDKFVVAFRAMFAHEARSLASAEKPPKRRTQTAREAARRVIVRLYGGDIPDQATLPNKLLCAAVAPHLPFPVAPDTILRAAGRK